MRQRVFLFLLSLLAVTALTACGSAEKAAEVPPLSEVEAMTDEEATEALAGFRRQDPAGRLGRAPGRIRRPVQPVGGPL